MTPNTEVAERNKQKKPFSLNREKTETLEQQKPKLIRSNSSLNVMNECPDAYYNQNCKSSCSRGVRLVG